jgi:hypothetical protein
MKIENIRYTELAVGLKPSAIECKAHLCGLWWIIFSKTTSLWLCEAKPACTGGSGMHKNHNFGLYSARSERLM